LKTPNLQPLTSDLHLPRPDSHTFWRAKRVVTGGQGPQINAD